jgi:hypothetical protein
MLRTDLKAIKRAKPNIEGKRLINSKEEHKIILGRSPDFGYAANDALLLQRAPIGDQALVPQSGD